MPVVRLSAETYERLNALATPFRGSELGTPEKVIEHLLGERPTAERKPAAAAEVGLRNLAHAKQRCSDPDCEIHHPEVIEDEGSRLTAMAWFEAGKWWAWAQRNR